MKVLSLSYLIFKRHIKICYKNFSQMLYPLIFDIGVLTILAFITNFVSYSITFKIAFLMILQFLSIMLNSRFLIEYDYKKGFFKEFLTTGFGIELFLFAKYKAHLLLSSIILLIKLPILSYILHFPLNWHILCIMILHLSVITILMIFSESLLINVRNKLLSIIITIPGAFACTLLSATAIEIPGYILLLLGSVIFITLVLFIISVFALNVSMEEI